MDKKDLIVELSLILMDQPEEVIIDLIQQVSGDGDKIVFVSDTLH
jgi:hypothetical protein